MRCRLKSAECLQTILHIRCNCVRNADICCMTERAPLSSTVTSRHLSLFGHVACMNENQTLFERLLKDWKRLPGRPCSSWLMIWPTIFWNWAARSERCCSNRSFWKLLSLHNACFMFNRPQCESWLYHSLVHSLQSADTPVGSTVREGGVTEAREVL